MCVGNFGQNSIIFGRVVVEGFCIVGSDVIGGNGVYVYFFICLFVRQGFNQVINSFFVCCVIWYSDVFLKSEQVSSEDDFFFFVF